MFKDCFDAHYEGFILESDKIICAYLITQTILDECHILTIGVKKESQHQGYATQLLQFLIDQKQKTCHRILLEVRESNAPAIYLYKKLGFERIALRKNYYQDAVKNQQENALIFEKKLTTYF
jgi:ribosomal-protein-alanine N-acetyltransferase